MVFTAIFGSSVSLVFEHVFPEMDYIRDCQVVLLVTPVVTFLPV